MSLIDILKKAVWFIVKYIITNIVVFGLIFIYVARIEPRWIEEKEQSVYITNLPAAFEGFRIVQLSDLHGKLFDYNEIANRVNRLKPDLVVITGDVFDQSEEIPVEYVEMALGGLIAKHGTYFVFGNNDTYLDKNAVKEKLANINIKALVNESTMIKLKGNSLYLVGVDDPYSQKADLTKALKGTGSRTKILLAHTPEIINVAAKAGVDLTLVGHTHGGQIMIPFVPRPFTNVSKGYEKYLSGLYWVGNSQMYVNRGLGENDIHMRFLSRPEITVITLHEMYRKE